MTQISEERIDFAGTGGFVSRADPFILKDVFEKYASVRVDSILYMTYDDFIRKYLGIFRQPSYNKDAVNILGNAVDTTKNGLISFEEFQAFEALLCAPDALYALAFQLFDTDGTGTISYDNFKTIIDKTIVNRRIPFQFDSEFITTVFGKNRQRKLRYAEFTQILHDYHEEHAIQAFKQCDEDGTGFISTLDFNEIMLSLKDHLLTDHVRNNLVRLGGLAQAYHVSFAYFMAFASLLNNMELIKRIYLNAAKGNANRELTAEEFMYEAHEYTQITPLEVTILYQIVDLATQSGKANLKVLESISPMQEHHLPFHLARRLQEKVQDVAQQTSRRSVFIGVLENSYRFLMGSIAGAIGATAVYPIDLVKTRMQNQRSTIGELLYKNSMDCFKKVLRYEGPIGLYRGLPPQLVGVAPEKAIKLTVNDLVRDQFTDPDGVIGLHYEMLAGATAGTCQVMFTNPLEIVKIRLQIAGEISTDARPSALRVVRELGLFGLYKGARACILRDAPFSAVYFSAYAHSKKALSDENGYNSPMSLLLAATISGAPAASLTTPMDVIKTRLQVVPRPGQTTYNGIFDCFRKILREEGGMAFWKGTGARVLRSSPQFGFTLLSYELLQRVFYIDFGGRKLEGADIHIPPELELPENPDHIGGYRLALASFSGIETKFGLQFPKYRSPYVQS